MSGSATPGSAWTRCYGSGSPMRLAHSSVGSPNASAATIPIPTDSDRCGCSNSETDGLDGAAFSICSFWYVEALTRTGRLDDAQLALEKMSSYANHVGLYAEQVSATGDLVGNFPQAFTYLALISAAINLDRAIDN